MGLLKISWGRTYYGYLSADLWWLKTGRVKANFSQTSGKEYSEKKSFKSITYKEKSWGIKLGLGN